MPMHRRDTWLTIPMDEGQLDVREDDIVAVKSNGKARSTIVVRGGLEYVVHRTRDQLIDQIMRAAVAGRPPDPGYM